MKSILLVFSLFCCVITGIQAQSYERVTYQPTHTPGMFANYGIYDMAYSDKYGLFVVGGFDQWGVKTARIAKLSESSDIPDFNFPRIYESATDIIADGKGGWFVAGNEFRSFNEGNALKNDFYYQGVVHILSNYSIDPDFRLNISQVNKMALWGNKLYVVGSFQGKQTSLLAFDATTGAAATAPNVVASSGLQNCVVYGNTLYVAGSQITSFNGTAINRSIIGINLPTGTLKNWGNLFTSSSWGGSQNIAVQGGKIIIGSRQSDTYSIAAFDTVTATAPLWQRTVSNSAVLCANQQYIFYASQVEAAATGRKNGRVSALNLADGTENTSLNLQNLGFNYASGQQDAAISSMACLQNTLFVGGPFDRVNTTGQRALASIDLSNGALKSWQPNPATDPANIASFILKTAGNALMVIGADYYKSQRTIHIALLNPISHQPINKSFDFLPYDLNGSALNGYGSSFSNVAVQGDILWIGGAKGGRTFIGSYNLVTGDSLNRVPITVTGGTISRLVAIDSLVYVYGNFTSINGQARRHLAVVSANGTVLPFSILAEPYSSFSWDCVKDFKIAGDFLYLCGTFTSINGISRKYLASVNRLTGQLTSWNPDPDQAISKIDVVDRDIYFSNFQQRIGSYTNTDTRKRNFLIDRFSGQVHRSWGTGETSENFVAKDKYLFMGFGFGMDPTNRCGSFGGTFTYYDLEYGSYAPNCIVKNSYATPIARNSRLIAAGSKIYTLFTNYLTEQSTREQQLLQVTFPPNFFHDQLTYFPKQGNTSGSVTVNFYGYKLATGTKVRLLKVGQPPIVAPDSLVRYPEAYRVEVILNLRNKVTGSWDIELTIPTGEKILIPNGFAVNPLLPPSIRIRINAPTVTRPGAPTRVTIAVDNRGETNAYTMPFWVIVPPGAQIEMPSGQPDANGITDGRQLELIPIGEEGGPVQGQAAWIGLPEVGGGTTVEIPLIVRPGPGTQPIQIKVIPEEKPLSIDPYSPEAASDPCKLTTLGNKCLNSVKDLALEALGYLPIVGCAQALCDTYQDIKNKKGPVDLYATTAGAVWGCTGRQLTRKAETIGKVGKALATVADWLSNVVSGVETVGTGIDVIDDCFPPDKKHPAAARIPVVTSQDPNDKIGPAGSGTLRYLAGESPLSYLIRFENYASASADAQYVLILDTLNRDRFDFTTFQFGYFNVADTVFEASPGRKRYLRDWDQRPTKNLILRMEADFNDTTGILKATYTTLDPATMLRTEDPVIGFLPPNITAPQGEGGIYFTIAPKTGLPQSTTIANRASIYFDYNAPIPTPPWSNVVDRLNPESRVAALPTTTVSSTFAVQWSGQDIGAGVRLYDVFVATNSGPFRRLLTNTSLTHVDFVGKADSTYQFYSIAVDSVGNEEATPVTFDTQTRIFAGSIISSVNSGNWNNPATWNCNCVPAATINVLIKSSHVVTVPATVTDAACKKLILEQNSQVRLLGKLKTSSP